MKVAVYTIALNEAKHIKRWYESSKDADYHLIADTGSTDDTVAIAKELGIATYQISVKPWRFDDARNAALCLLDRKSTRLNSSHIPLSRMPSSA